MRNVWIICRKELRSYFASPIAYILLIMFGVIFGFFFWNALGAFVFESVQSEMSGSTSVLPAPVSDFAPAAAPEDDGWVVVLLEPQAATPAATTIAVATELMRRMDNVRLLGFRSLEASLRLRRRVPD